MGSVSEVLRFVAESEYYGDDLSYESEKRVSRYMCISLHMVLSVGFITLEEYDEASSEIVKYLSQLVKDRYSESLEEALDYNCLDSSFEARKKIYLDWDNRPMPWKE